MQRYSYRNYSPNKAKSFVRICSQACKALHGRAAGRQPSEETDEVFSVQRIAVWEEGGRMRGLFADFDSIKSLTALPGADIRSTSLFWLSIHPV